MKNFVLISMLFLAFSCGEEEVKEKCSVNNGNKSCCHNSEKTSGNIYIDSLRGEIMSLHDDVIMPKNVLLSKLRADIQSSTIDEELKAKFDTKILSAQGEMDAWMKEMGTNYDVKSVEGDTLYFREQVRLANSIKNSYYNALLIKDSI
jgi:hypothetical protein